MANLSSIERRKLERLFRMGGGYVLDFSDRTFSEFFEEHTRRDIDAAVYRERGTSKATCRSAWPQWQSSVCRPVSEGPT